MKTELQEAIEYLRAFNLDASATILEDRFLKKKEQILDTSKVTRVEVIQHSAPYNGRAFVNCSAKDVEIQLQDDDKTLKIFLK